MTTYELRIHARDVTITESGNVDIGNHTGCLLYTSNPQGQRHGDFLH